MKIKNKFIIISVLIILVLAIFLLGRDLYMDNYLNKIRILDLKSEEKCLLFYGSGHSNDKSNPMFKDIEEKFYNTNPQVVLVEGDANYIEYKSIDQAIAQGESAFVSYLAQKDNVLVKSVEPSQKEQYKYLLDKYDENSVLMMYIFRQIDQYQHQNDVNLINYEERIQKFVHSMMDDGFPISDNEADIGSLLSLVNQYTGQTIDNDNWLKLDAKSFYFDDNSKLNEIYNDISTVRNNHLLTNIEEALRNYDRIFVIMGSWHIVEEGKKIKEIFNNSTVNR